MMAFHVGQKVVCIKDDDFLASNGRDPKAGYPVKGQCYIVDEIEIDHCPCECAYLVLKELSLDDCFIAKYFRPLTERKTDISLFNSLLNPALNKELVEV